MIKDMTMVRYRGLSSDTKPSGPAAGSTFHEMDTGIIFAYDAVNDHWEEMLIGKEHTVSGSTASFTTALTKPLKALTVSLEPIQEGSGDPSPDNVRAITGHSSVNVTRVGKNLYDPTNALDGYWISTTGEIEANSSWWVSNPIFVIAGQTYYKPSTGSSRCAYYNADGTVIAYAGIGGDRSFTAAYTGYFRFAGATATIAYNGNVQFELGSSATTYEPYTGSTFTTSLGQTVYGGTLDVVSGVLTVTHGIVDLGTLTWQYITSTVNPIFATESITDMVAGTRGVIPDATSDRYAIVASNYRSALAKEMVSGEASIIADYAALAIRNDAYTSASDFKDAMSGSYLVYPLATPTTVQLTPQEVRTLKGNNAVWSDSGDVSVTYLDKT